MLRHERQTVAMELAAALHHSREVWPGSYFAPRGPKVASSAGGREEEAREPYDALRGQKRPPPGTRPGVLPDPGPQWGAVTVGYVAAPVPHLAPPALTAEVDEALDAIALQFLIQRGLEDKLKEERAKAAEEVAVVAVAKMQEERKKEAKKAWSKLTAGFRVSDAERDLAASGFAFPSSSSSSRKRKKKRKKRTRRRVCRRSRRPALLYSSRGTHDRHRVDSGFS